MSVADLQTKIPRFTAPTIAGLFVASLLYSVLVTANITLWFAVWGGLLSVGIGLFVIYLFYRFVLAVERIADNQ